MLKGQKTKYKSFKMIEPPTEVLERRCTGRYLTKMIRIVFGEEFAAKGNP